MRKLGAELNDNGEMSSLLDKLSAALGTKDNFRLEPEAVEEHVAEVLDVPEPAREQVSQPIIEEPDEHRAAAASSPAVPTSLLPPVGRKVLSAHQIQEVILQGLGQVPDFPNSGVAVTVYGFRPWGAMLTFAPGSTSQKNAITFREALTDIVHELRTKVEIAIN